jgi:hypothetical protein
MALFRRAPRQVYRVFSETDFLAGGDAGELLEPATTGTVGQRSLRGIAGAAMLVGAVAAAVAMLVVHRPAVRTPARPQALDTTSAAGHGGRPTFASGAAQALPGGREMPRTITLRRRPGVSDRGSAALAASVRMRIESPTEDAVSSTPQLEHAEFGFER